MRPSDGPEGGSSGEGFALASIVLASLLMFPAAVPLGVLALLRLPRTSGYRKVAICGTLLGVVEGAAVLGLLVIVAGYDPYPGRARAAVDQLRKIAKAQEKFKAQARVDQDGDGVGEYGLLPELAGAPLPGPHRESAAGQISGVFRQPTALGYVEKYGYYFALFLPGRGWGDALDGRGIPRKSKAAFADAQERCWIAYAWPAVRGRTARGIFVATSAGVFRAENTTARFSGEVKMPQPISALSGRSLESLLPLPREASISGETWERVE
ncbi:MAG: hypothetical protein ACYS47_16355 [Planctomycetota bacterium]|jgi:hypothetical protein